MTHPTSTDTVAGLVSRCVLLVPLLLLSLLSSVRAGPATAPAGVPLQTEHYDLYLEQLDPDDTGKLLEAFHAHLESAFGRAPGGRLRVELYATRAGFDAALQRDRIGPVQAGGYYSPANRTAYLFVQPSEYFTRQLLLHECAHQFHFLVATGNRAPRLGLYTEGLAEFFAMHDWDGERLRAGVIPAITLEDYPAKALADFTGKLQRDFAGLISGNVTTDRAAAWAVVRFLRERHPDQFKTWSNRLDAGDDPAAVAREVFGDTLDALRDEFEPWLRRNQQPWTVATISWQQRGDDIQGHSDGTVGIALLKEAPQELAVELAVDRGPAMAGLTVNYLARDDYRILHMMPDRSARLLRLSGANWIREGWWPAAPLPPGQAQDRLVARRHGNVIDLYANGRKLSEVPNTGELGVHVQTGRVRFRRIG